LLEGSDELSLGENASAVTAFFADGLTQQVSATFGRFSVDAVFNLLESRGLGRAIARPSLTVLSGERALFLVGGEVPIPESFVPTIGTVTPGTTVTPGVFSSVEFRSFGVQLNVRPLVGDDGSVTLDVVSQVSRPDESLTALVKESTGTDQLAPSFESRSVRTSARLEDGDTLLLAGLTNRRSTDGATYTPWLERIPLLGWLFKRYSMRDEDLELVIALHPLVIRRPIRELELWEFSSDAEVLSRLSKNLTSTELDPALRHSGREARSDSGLTSGTDEAPSLESH
jgi:type II secretory pathway component GspD/PulD (secretin)